MIVYRGERRLVAVDLAALLAGFDALAAIASVETVRKSGRVAVDFLTEYVAAPEIVGTEVRAWVEIPTTQDRDLYLLVVTCTTENGETIVEEAPLIVS